VRGEPESIRALVNNSSEGGDRSRGDHVRYVPPTITEAVLTDDPPFAPGFPSGTRSVNVKFSDRTERTLFSFYTDELAFTGSEFIGLTEAEARDLFRQRDMEYLRS
jgi:hypothetical protein